MRIRQWPLTLGLILLGVGASSLAAQAPAGATAKCKDDTYSTTKSHRGACKGHGGVAEWLTTADTKTKAKAKTAAPVQTATAPAGPAPADATAQCKDGSYSTSASQRGACKGHGGGSEWLAETKPATKAPPAAAPAKPAPSAEAPPAAAPAPAPTTAKAPPPAGAPADASALCKDGSYSHAQHHRGACSKHGGVQQWLKDIPK